MRTLNTTALHVGAPRTGLIVLIAALLALAALAWGGAAVAAPDSTIAALDIRADLEQQTFDDINEARQQRGVAALNADSELGNLARERSQDMALNHYFSHYAADGSLIFVRLLDADNVPFLKAGENLAWNTYSDDVSAQVAVDGWKASPAHARNLYDSAYSRAGLGAVNADGKKYYTIIFVGD